MTEDKPKNRLWLRLILGISLALNLLVIGLVAGAAWRFGGPEGRPAPRSLGSALFFALPKEDRKALRQKSYGSHQDRRARAQKDASDVIAALRASPFDETSLERILQEQAASQQAHHQALQSSWMTRIRTMSEAERLAYADRLEEVMARKGKGRHRD